MKLVMAFSALLMSVFSLKYMQSYNITQMNTKDVIKAIETEKSVLTCGSGTHGSKIS